MSSHEMEEVTNTDTFLVSTPHFNKAKAQVVRLVKKDTLELSQCP